MSKISGVYPGLSQSSLLKTDKPGVTPEIGNKDFQQTLKEAGNKTAVQNPDVAQAKPEVKFSQHAIERMHSRGISLNPEQIQQLDQAVEKAAEKGAKETLVITDDSAMVVSVKNKTVITAMDRALMKDNVFTNIDSTVFL